jgi:hypothetical protein
MALQIQATVDLAAILHIQMAALAALGLLLSATLAHFLMLLRQLDLRHLPTAADTKHTHGLTAEP